MSLTSRRPGSPSFQLEVTPKAGRSPAVTDRRNERLFPGADLHRERTEPL
jgi:hypothetical protein